MIINEGTMSYGDIRVGLSIEEQIRRWKLRPGDLVFWGCQVPSDNPQEIRIQCYSARIKSFKVHPIWLRPSRDRNTSIQYARVGTGSLS